jgi:eukaryotic-like serine/threonine-protein kinase
VAEATQTMSTDEHQLVGTPQYFSPEAITTPDQVEPRSDLYALGAVMYYLLAGVPVFEARTVVELCAHHLHTTPQRPSARSGRPIDADLEAVVLQCLAKAPAERPSSALARCDALLACRAAGSWTWKDADACWARHRQDAALPLNHSTKSRP